jgi:DNA-binding beta-propeller fold protein YncE
MPSSFSLLFPRPYLLVANMARKGPVLRYDMASGDFVDSFVVVDRPDPQFGSIDSLPFDVQIGPDGGVYVLVLNPQEVWRYSPAGKFASVFVPNLQNSADNRQAYGMAFGPDKNLYLSTQGGVQGSGSEILRFDGKTGAPLGVSVPAGSGGFQGVASIAFGPDGNLYLAGDEITGILRFNGLTGAFLDVFVATHPYANDISPRGLAFGSDGNLYALAAPAPQPGGAPGYTSPNRILRYNGATGASMGEFVSPGGQLGQPMAIAFGPDGNLYVGTTKPLIRFGPRVIYTGQIVVYDGTTGGFIRALDSLNRAGLAYPISMAFAAIPISIRDIIFLSRIPRWMWPVGLGFIAGVIASRINGRVAPSASPRGGAG